MKALTQSLLQTLGPFAQSTEEGVAGQRAEEASDQQTRQRDAVQQMVEQHSRLVYRVAFAVARNPADAEEVVQETFLQLLRGAPGKFLNGSIADERAYLARIAWRLAVRRKVRSQAEERSTEILLGQAAPGRSPEQAALDSDLEAWLHQRIGQLPPKLRQPLVLAALGELTSAQIGAVLGIPEGSVRRRIHTARQMLKQALTERKGGAHDDRK